MSSPSSHVAVDLVAQPPSHFNPHLHVRSSEISGPGLNGRVRVLQYNVDQAMREERESQKPGKSQLAWRSRGLRVRDLIRKADADIVCLQELRQLPEYKPPLSWLGDLVAASHTAGRSYHFEMGYRNPGDLSFAQVILYDRRRFYADQVVKRWLSDAPPETMADTWTKSAPGSTGGTVGYLALCVHLLPVHDGKIVVDKPGFWVVNVHLGMEEEVKTRSCQRLVELVTRTQNTLNPPLVEEKAKEALILAGDFNFFPDRDGAKQCAILTQSGGLQDCAAVCLPRTSQKNKEIRGTFIGYEHDEFKAPLSTAPQSMLDHVFLRNCTIAQIESPLVALTETMTYSGSEPEELTNRDALPSDHLPLLATLQLSF
jgi:endonuclease/exonuclease/phosphatase family metal-dependent hydrolase